MSPSSTVLRVLLVLYIAVSLEGKVVKLGSKSHFAKNVTWVGQNYRSLIFDKKKSVYWALSEDGMSVDKISSDVEVTQMFQLPLPGRLMSLSDNNLVVMHIGYFSVMMTSENATVHTHWAPIEDASGIVATGNMTYMFSPRTSFQFGRVLCENLEGSSVSTFSHDSYFAYPHPNGRWVYLTQPYFSPDSIQKFSISGGKCNATLLNTSPFSEYSCGAHIWFSTDGTRIFLENGRSLVSSSDKTMDLKVRGCLNSDCDKVKYNDIVQASEKPYTVYAVQSDTTKIYAFTWPFLNLHHVINIPEIPTPETKDTRYSLRKVDVVKTGQLMVVITKEDKSTKVKTNGFISVKV